MSKKDKYSRFDRCWNEKPEEPKLDVKKFAVMCLTSAINNSNNFPDNEHYYDQMDDYEDAWERYPEFTGKLPRGQFLSLEEVNKLVRENNIDEKNVFFTACFSEEYLSLEAVHIKELSDQEKLEQYAAQCEEWEDQQKLKEEQELQRIKWQMENLQRRASELTKKK